MVINIQRVSPLFAAFDSNREAFRIAIEAAAGISATKMGSDAASLFSVLDGRVAQEQLMAA